MPGKGISVNGLISIKKPHPLLWKMRLNVKYCNTATRI